MCVCDVDNKDLNLFFSQRLDTLFSILLHEPSHVYKTHLDKRPLTRVGTDGCNQSVYEGVQVPHGRRVKEVILHRVTGDGL